MKISAFTAFLVVGAFAVATAITQVEASGQTVPVISTAPQASPEILQTLDEYRHVQPQLEQVREKFGDQSFQVVTLRSVVESLANKLKRSSHMHLDSVELPARQTRGELEELRRALQDITGRVDVSPEGLRAAMRSLEEQRQALVIEQAGERARREATQEIVAQETERAHDVAQNDPVTQELTQLVELRKKVLAQINAAEKTGATPAGSAMDAQSALTEAQIKLAEHVKDSAAGSIAGLNEKLEEMTIEEAEKRATLQAVNDQLEKLAKVSSRIDELEQLQNRVIDAEADLRQAEIDARLVDRELTISPPGWDTTRVATTEPTTQG
jgi:hypothetical protein